MEVLPTPEILSEQSALLQMLVWVFLLIFAGLSSALIVLWKAKESRDEYIKGQDKANLLAITELTALFKNLGIDVSKIEQSLFMLSKIDSKTESISPKLDEIRTSLLKLSIKLSKTENPNAND